jgi:membrane associated rhomboid family serine protease
MVSRWVRWLHPFDPWWTMPLMWKAYALQGQGRVEEAIALWSQVPAMRDEVAVFSEILRMRQAMRWHELAETLVQDITASETPPFPVKLAYLLRSLGESGRLAEMEEMTLRYRSMLPLIGEQVDLFLLAFFGQVDALDELMRGQRSLPPSSQDYWHAVALAAQTRYAEASVFLDKAAAHRDVEELVKQQIAWRREHLEDLGNPEPSEEMNALLQAIHRRHSERLRLNIFASPEKKRRPLVTYSITVVLTLIFLMQIAVLPSPLQGMRLLRWGAFSPPLFWGGEYWRLLTSNLLHADGVHLSVNLFSLLLFGPFAEGWLGRWRYALLFVFSGVIANLLLLGATELGWMPRYYLLVGASSAIMGILGAAAAVLLRVHRRMGSLIARRNLFFLASLLLLQAVFDYFSPHTSGAAHLTGAFAGFLLAVLIFPNSHLQRIPQTADPSEHS